MKRKTRGKKSIGKMFFKKKSTVLIIISLLIAALLVYFFVFSSSTTVYEAIPYTAAIIDQLAISHPNTTFIQNAKNTLISTGYSVDYYNYSQITVNFYKQLPSKRYSLIILRVHSGVGWFTGLTSFYTSELYNEWAHYLEQTKDQVVPVGIENVTEPRYFAITSNFVKASDICKNSAVIMMGCEGLKKTDMAKALIEKGANVYISWNGSVTSEHTDKATDQLLRNLIFKNQTIGEAINNTMNTAGPDPDYHSLLSYYPSESTDYIITTKPKTVSISTFHSSFSISRSFKVSMALSAGGLSVLWVAAFENFHFSRFRRFSGQRRMMIMMIAMMIIGIVGSSASQPT